MKTLKAPVSLILILLCSITAVAQWQNKGFTFQGNARQYRVYTPSNYNASNPASMVITLHGLGDNMTNFSGIGMNLVADTANIIVVVPQAVSDPFAGTAWNSGAGYAGYYPNASVDDVAFISALIDTVQNNFAINPSRIYACGFSMGGFMTERLALFLNNKINSFASVAGTFGFGLPSYNPNKNVSILHFHGTADGTVPYAGNTSGIGADSLVNFWVNNNQCNTTPVYTSIPDSQNDGYTVEHYLYSGGQNNTEVEFFKVTGAAHVWLTGANDISYTTEIWKFFNKHQALLSGVKEQSHKVSFSIYPNPANDVVYFKSDNTNLNETCTAKITDLSGREIAETSVVFEKGSCKLFLQALNLSKGLYLLELTGRDFGAKSVKFAVN